MTQSKINLEFEPTENFETLKNKFLPETFVLKKENFSEFSQKSEKEDAVPEAGARLEDILPASKILSQPNPEVVFYELNSTPENYQLVVKILKYENLFQLDTSSVQFLKDLEQQILDLVLPKTGLKTHDFHFYMNKNLHQKCGALFLNVLNYNAEIYEIRSICNKHVDAAINLIDVIENLELDENYYKKVSLQYITKV